MNVQPILMDVLTVVIIQLDHSIVAVTLDMHSIQRITRLAMVSEYYCTENNERNCIDINECKANNGGCDHICTNTESSYICSCNSGYQIESDEHNCTGIFDKHE